MDVNCDAQVTNLQQDIANVDPYFEDFPADLFANVDLRELEIDPMILDDIMTTTSTTVHGSRETAFVGPTRVRRRHRRILFTAQQLIFLQHCYERTPYLTRQQAYELATLLSTDVKRIQVWFQNKRHKERVKGHVVSQMQNVDPSYGALSWHGYSGENATRYDRRPSPEYLTGTNNFASYPTEAPNVVISPPATNFNGSQPDAAWTTYITSPNIARF